MWIWLAPKKSGEEEKVKRILTDPKLAGIKAMLEKDHAIDCIMLLHLDRGKWKDAKDFMRENKLTLSDGTFRARMIEIEDLGLAESERIDPLKKLYKKTEFGEKVAQLLLKLFDQLETWFQGGGDLAAFIFVFLGFWFKVGYIMELMVLANDREFSIFLFDLALLYCFAFIFDIVLSL